MNYVIGKNSRLGLALKNEIEDITLIPSNIFLDAIKNKSLLELFKNANSIINCISITNPHESKKNIESINYNAPLKLNNFCIDRGIRFINFGSVFEESDIENNYIHFKRKCSNDIIYENTIHFRLNTIYGGILKPIEHMFLGQIFNALQNNKQFNMTSGYQYREYHTYDSIARYVGAHMYELTPGIHDISSGDGIMLRDLAKSIFETQNAIHLLKIGDEYVESEQMKPRNRTINKKIKYINTNLIEINSYIRRSLSKTL
jgi:hypothetical protein